VAAITLCRRRDVARGLARGGLAIVTGRAGTAHRRMIEADRRKFVGIVTGFARRGRSNVARRFPWSHLSIVAPCALRRRCLKCGSEVATLAGDGPVLPRQRKARGHVVEFGDGLRPRNRRDKRKDGTKRARSAKGQAFPASWPAHPPRLSGTHDEGTPRLQPWIHCAAIVVSAAPAA
jgi:hypothetical protein